MQKGKGGKDPKGKGKDLKSKGKGKEEKGKGKSKNGKFGGGAKEGKGKGTKDNKGGKGKGNGEVCWTCGKPGHQAKDCWRVRQAEAPATQSVAGSRQRTTSPSTTTSGTGGGGDQSAAAKSIRRVSQPAVFDLREASTGGSIRVVQEATVEYYNIFTDDENEDAQAAYVVNTVHERREDSEMNEDMVEDGIKGPSMAVIVDSGADASLFPGFMRELGEESSGGTPHLQDAQGTKIKTYGSRGVDIILWSTEGRQVVLKEKVTFSDCVSQPIISFGRLMRSGWSLDANSMCLTHGELEVPLTFQNQSLVVDACVRTISKPQVIRTLAVQLSEELQRTSEERYGWRKKDDHWLGLHLGRSYQSPQFIPGFRSQEEGFCRSTLVNKGGQWELVEMAEPIDSLEDQAEATEELKGEDMSRILTFIAKEGTTPENFGFELSEGFKWYKPRVEEIDDHATPEANEAEEVEDMEIPGGEQAEGVSLDDQLVRFEVGPALPSHITVNDVVLTLESPLRSLRAACSYYKIGQSGGKKKCLGRLLEHQNKMELLLAKDLAAQTEAFEKRIPLEQAVAKEPTEEERRQHQLTHIPYAPWCASRLKHRARQDQHRRTGRAREQGCPTISFDLCHVRASGSGALGREDEEDKAQLGVSDEGGALLLVAVCSQTGYLLGLPLKSKGQLALITHELLAFTQILGHEEVQYYSGNEPTLRQALKLLVQSRSAFGLKTTMRTTRIYDAAGNSLVENAIQRIRNVAATLMESLTQSTVANIHYGHGHADTGLGC